MTLSTIIEKKKEEFEKEFPEIWSENYKKSHFGCYMNESVKKFLEKAIRESVEEALREVQLSNDTVVTLSTKYYPDTNRDYTARHRALGLVGDVIGRIDDRVKEFMK